MIPLFQNGHLRKVCPTKRAPDAGDSAHIPSSFLRLFIFPVGRLRRPHPSAGNANRWAAEFIINGMRHPLVVVGSARNSTGGICAPSVNQLQYMC